MTVLSDIFTCQRILSIMVILGFMIHHMLRVNITIAIIDMMISENGTNLQQNITRYNWDENQRNEILGFFFWGYIVTQIPGGRLSEIYGSKIVVSIGFFLSSVLTILTPMAADNYYLLLFVRFSIGLSLGVHWPSTFPLATKWVSSKDSSVFTSHMIACSLGSALTLPICGYLISSFGWPSVFYCTGGAALFWTICWIYFVYDSPRNHPRISKEEFEKLTKEIRDVKKILKTPWKKIFTSTAVWSLIIGNVATAFLVFILLFQLPAYIYQVLHLNIEENGWLSSFPYIARYFSAVVSSYLADRLLKLDKFSTTTIRKFLNVTSFGGSAVLFAIQALWGYNYTVSASIFTSSFCFLGLASPGILANFIDISPSFCGTLMAISQTPVGLFGYISTKIVAYFTEEEQNFKQWSYIFWIVVGVNIFTALFCCVFTTGEVQPWNDITEESKEKRTLEKDDLLKVGP